MQAYINLLGLPHADPSMDPRPRPEKKPPPPKGENPELLELPQDEPLGGAAVVVAEQTLLNIL